MSHETDHDNLPEKKSLGEWFFKTMKKWKNNIAQHIPHTGHVETYGDLLKKCVRTAIKLQEIATTEDIIGVCALNDENVYVPFVASQFIGVKVANFHPELPEEITIYLLKLVRPTLIFVSADGVKLIEECLEKANIATRLVVFGKSEKHEEFSEYLKVRETEDKFEPVARNVEDTAVIVFTSGSTGHPKGVCFNHHTLLSKHDSSYLIASKFPVILTYSTLYWISGILMFMKSVEWGGSLVSCPKFVAIQMWKIIESYKVTTMLLPPFLARKLFDYWHTDIDASSLHMIIIGGNQVSFDLLKDVTSALPNVNVANTYSQTEFGNGFMDPVILKHKDVLNRSPKVFSCGMVSPECDWKIVDPSTEKILNPNEKGEFRIKSNHIMNGYYKTDSSSAFDADGYYKTGDLFYYDEDKYMYIVGRLTTVFKYRSWHISPVVIEDVLVSHPAVEDAIVIDIPDETDGNHPMGLIKLKKGYEAVTSKEIEDFVAGKLYDYEKLRGGIKFIRDIPYTVTGKKRRNEFREQVLNGLVDYVPISLS